MFEEQVLVSPVRGGEATDHVDGTDECFNTTKWKRLVGGVNVIDCGVSWETLKLGKVGQVALEFSWNQVLNRSVRMESQFEWENDVSHLFSSLVVLRVVRKT